MTHEDNYEALTQKEYNSLPEMQLSDIPEGSGIRHNDIVGLTQEVLTRYIAKALKDPQWLLVPKYTEEYASRVSRGLAVAQYIDPYAYDRVMELTRGKSDNELHDVADGIRSHRIDLGNGMASVDVVVRALEIMGKEFPNLSMYRGTNFDPDDGYSGIDFAPGDLPTALRYAPRGYTHVRKYPVIVVLPFAEMANQYTHGNITLSTEGDWARGSLAIGFRRGVKNPATIRRLPSDGHMIEQLKATFTQRAVNL